MNDAIPQERFFQRAGSDFRRRVFPLRPTSILRRELTAAFPIVLLFLLLMVSFCFVLLIGGEPEWTSPVAMILSTIGMLGVFSIGVLAAMPVSRFGRTELIRVLPVPSWRAVGERWFGSLIVLVIWFASYRCLSYAALWLLGDRPWRAASTGQGPLGEIIVLGAVIFWPHAASMTLGAWFGRWPLFCVAAAYVVHQVINSGIVLSADVLFDTTRASAGLLRYYLLAQLVIGLTALALFAHRYYRCEAMPS